MSDWLQIAKEKISKRPDHSTAITDNRDLMSLLTVHRPQDSDVSPASNVTIGSTSSEVLSNFFEKAPTLDIELLYDDIQWLIRICLGIPAAKLRGLFDGYIRRWLKAMSQEPAIHKRQNIGRYHANTFLRETLSQTRYNSINHRR